MTEEIKTEIEKRIEEGAIEFEKQAFLMAPYKETDLSDAFRAGAKFILELPELRGAVEILKFYGDEDNWMNPDAHVPYWTLWSDGANVGFNEAKNALSKLRVLWIVKESGK